jgi:hypothetical protein
MRCGADVPTFIFPYGQRSELAGLRPMIERDDRLGYAFHANGVKRPIRDVCGTAPTVARRSTHWPPGDPCGGHARCPMQRRNALPLLFSSRPCCEIEPAAGKESRDVQDTAPGVDGRVQGSRRATSQGRARRVLKAMETELFRTSRTAQADERTDSLRNACQTIDKMPPLI